MITHESLEQIPSIPQPIALTIGTFDGVHLGHQYLLQELKKQGTPVVVTFSNHPAEVLYPGHAPNPILTLQEKLRLLEHFGVAMTIVLAFTHELSQMPYDQFLQKLSFSVLMGGEDMRIGARGEGEPKTIASLGYKMGYKTLFIPKLKINGVTISSRLIRELIKTHNFDQAQKWLGHHKGSLWQASPVES